MVQVYEIGICPDCDLPGHGRRRRQQLVSGDAVRHHGPLSAHGLGVQEASCSYTDAGGLLASSSVTYSIVDTTAPTITFDSRTPANANGWNNGDVTVTWTCSDSGGSGVVDATVSETVSYRG